MYVGCRKESYLYSAVGDGNARAIPMRFKSKLDFQTMKHIRDIVQKHSIDIINAQSSKDRYLSIFARKFYKLDTLIIHTRRQMPLMDAGKLQGWFYNTFTDKIIAVSEAVKNGLMAGGIKDAKIEVIYNGTPKEKYDNINTDRVGRLVEKYEIRDDEFVIGCVSRRKKQDQLIKALSLIEKPVKVIFVGIQRDDFPESLVQSVPSRHSLTFCGTVPFDEVLEYYKLFDVSVLPSTTEGLSQALLEAMALGVP
ncbi:MAG: glycosyltransferase, partial [Candidatus Marinimicrobia bacterium]|nr:glycosyltransferase [Candidatus Neomarinimicrobiota bacterium]